MTIVHTMPIYPGMTPRECWQHCEDAGVGNAVPEFERELALGRVPAWVNVVEDDDGRLVGIGTSVGTIDAEELDEPYWPRCG